jgi:hypothetical protein
MSERARAPALEPPRCRRASRRSAERRSARSEARTADLVWTTGARVKRYDWEAGRYYMEELSLAPKAVRLERLNGGGAPLLNSHSRWSLGDVLGVVEKGSAKVDGQQGVAQVRFSKREEVEPIFRDVKDKIIVNVSCGYAIYRMEQLPPDAPATACRSTGPSTGSRWSFPSFRSVRTLVQGSVPPRRIGCTPAKSSIPSRRTPPKQERKP